MELAPTVAGRVGAVEADVGDGSLQQFAPRAFWGPWALNLALPAFSWGFATVPFLKSVGPAQWGVEYSSLLCNIPEPLGKRSAANLHSIRHPNPISPSSGAFPSF